MRSNPKTLGAVGRALVLSAAGGAAIYIAIACWVGWRDVSGELQAISGGAVAGALALALVNYGFRFLKWELYLRRLGLRIGLRDSLQIFLAGFSLTMTPGKVGELVKAYLLRETQGVPMARTAPMVVAERVTDLIALLALSIAGIASIPIFSGSASLFLWFAGGLVGGFLLVASWRGLMHQIFDGMARLAVLSRLVPKLREFYDSTFELVRPLPLTLATLLSLAAWAAECAAYWLVVRSFGAGTMSLALSAFIYASMTIAGALSFLPGGIGVQEAGMIALTVRTAGLGRGAATAATFLVRLCTLWFAIALGIGCLLLVRRRMGVSLDGLERDPAAALAEAERR